MSKFNIRVLSKIPNLCKELQLKLPNSNITSFNLKETPIINSKDILKDSVDVIVADFDLLAPHLNDIQGVKFIQGTWAGIDKIVPFLKDHQRPLNIPIIRYSGIHFGRLISEYVISAIVNQERDLYRVYQNQNELNWSQKGKIHDYRAIYDLNIGIMGTGNIGSQLLVTLNVFGAHLKALGRRETAVNLSCHEYFSSIDLQEFLKGCDYIINTLPNTSETKGLLNGDLLEICKESSPFFINVGRGGIIDDNQLVKAIENKWISGAVLDVFNEEPLPKESDLWKLPEVTITPHVAAVSRAKDIAEQFSINLDLFARDLPIPNKVDYLKGY